MIIDYKKIEKAWKKYVAGDAVIPERIDGVRQEIVESWRRSKAHANPFDSQVRTLSKTDFERSLQENALLIKIAFPYLVDFYECLQNTNYQILLADKNGCQLKRISKDEQLDEFSNRKQILAGTLFSEEVVGTNGIGLCLAIKKPMMVLGPEHFNQIYSTVVCYAAPIYDPERNLIGCININGPLDAFEPLIMGMLRSAVSGIEKEFQLTKSYNMLDQTLESLTSGVVLLDSQGQILHYNKLATKLLGLQKYDLLGRFFFDVIRKASLPVRAQQLDQPLANIGCTLQNIDGQLLDVSLTIKPQDKELNGLDSTLILINSQRYIHRLTNKVAGFSATYTFDTLYGVSQAISTIKKMGKIAAESTSPVLIFGEIGTEKEILAQSIHNASERAGEPFVAVNCGTQQKSLLFKELFGSTDDAGDGGHPGKLELANGGTLFLDEVSNLTLEVQADLLQIIEIGTLQRFGVDYEKAHDIRIIAATSSNLFSDVQAGVFRDDLYYRLNALNMVIPPLRERPEDIAVLIEHYIEQYGQLKGLENPEFSAECIDALMAYPWPNNNRELESVVERMIGKAVSGNVLARDLPLEIQNHYYATKVKHEDTTGSTDESNTNKQFQPRINKECHRIEEALKSKRGNVAQAAKTLNMPLSTLYRKISKFGLDAKEYRK